jgi:hypothetical protein
MWFTPKKWMKQGDGAVFSTVSLGTLSPDGYSAFKMSEGPDLQDNALMVESRYPSDDREARIHWQAQLKRVNGNNTIIIIPSSFAHLTVFYPFKPSGLLVPS